MSKNATKQSKLYKHCCPNWSIKMKRWPQWNYLEVSGLNRGLLIVTEKIFVRPRRVSQNNLTKNRPCVWAWKSLMFYSNNVAKIDRGKIDPLTYIIKNLKTVQLHHSFYTIWTYSHLDFRSKWIACFKWDAYRSTKTIFFYDSIVLSFLLSLSIARNEWRFAIMYEIRNAVVKFKNTSLNILRSRNT